MRMFSHSLMPNPKSGIPIPGGLHGGGNLVDPGAESVENSYDLGKCMGNGARIGDLVAADGIRKESDEREE